jgi:tetratricopeptide (TPR) repeat protein
MKAFYRSLVLAGVLASGISQTAFAQSDIIVQGQNEKTSWNEAKSAHFTVYGQMSENDIRKYAEDLERYDAALREIIGGSTSSPVTVYVMQSIGKVQELAGGIRGVAGFYSGTAQSAIAVTSTESIIRSDFKFTAKQVMFHEYAHHMLLASANESQPGWMSEGMAEFFGTATLGKDGSITIGAPPGVRGFSIAGMNRWSAAQLLESDGKKISSEESEQRYSRGWLMVHYLLLGGKRNGQLPQFIKLLNSGVKPLEAGKQAFGDLKKLDSETDRYMRSATFPGLTFIPKATKDGIPVVVRNLSQAEADIMPSRLVSVAGVTEERAKSLLKTARPIAAKYPTSIPVQRALTEMEYDARNWNEAEAAADRALALDSNNVMAIIYKGRAQGQRAYAAKDAAQWKSARSLFLKANRVDPEYALPFVLYYDSFLAAGQKPNEGAISGLLRSVVLVPQDLSLYVRIALLRLLENDLVGARKIFAQIAANPHSGPQGEAARKIVAKLDEKADIADIMALVKEEKLDIINEFTPPDAFKKDDKKGKGKKD